jgi:hypothetical protein
MGNTHISHRYFLLPLIGLPVFGQNRYVRAEFPSLGVFLETVETDFDLPESIFTPPQISAVAPNNILILFYYCLLYHRPTPDATSAV